MIRTISIREPWLHCILHLGKRIENRVWSTSYRGPVLLHRAKAMSKREHRDALVWISEHVSPEVAARVPSYSEMRLVDRGAIVGVADLVACERNGGLWTPDERGSWRMAGQWGFRLENVRAFQESVFHRGALQLFGVDDALVEAAMAGAVPCDAS